MRVLIFGAGYSGRAIGQCFAQAGVPVSGTTRSTANFAALKQLGIEPFQFDGSVTEALAAEIRQTTHLILSAAPDATGDPVLNAAGDLLRDQTPALQWVGYLSTIGVYGDRAGGWVAEDDLRDPTSTRGQQRVVAEQAWNAFGSAKGIPVAQLRLGGIYGPGRNTFLNLEDGKARRIIKPGQVFNRIHVEDIAGATELLARGKIGGAFNIVDDEPAPPQDVITFAADLMGVEPPPAIPFDEADMSPMARSFYGDNKRISNAKLRQAGYAFRYPNYRVALQAMMQAGNWRDAG
ncbi:SDR family oxidoreductase [Tianweitania sp. BSSL-BM11]|uniref:SDR family oxidoreductase n=1 Tax=Tianweitania aestuarii TaxID=2814886 RepID=A0ABS5RPZ9_9HYPH|nr:SDR family oxidoreductase [Tianweitania aestuarii]MBS9719074.1 SDR family oxidoreductase [Tianweitania aestuarii]